MNLSFHNLALDGMVATIQALKLTGVPNGGTPLPVEQVYKRVLPSDLNVVLPAVIVSEAPLPETTTPSMTGTDDIGYPCAVTILVAKNQDMEVDDAALYWRQHIAGTFHYQKPALLQAALVDAVPLLECIWEPGVVLDLELLRSANLWASAMIIRVRVRKTRP